MKSNKDKFKKLSLKRTAQVIDKNLLLETFKVPEEDADSNDDVVFKVLN
jgi:hypothetical protein